MAFGRVVVIDPDGAFAESVAKLALGPEIEVRRVATAAEARERPADVIIACDELGDATAALAEAQRRDPDAYRVLAAREPGAAVAALNAGCADAVLVRPQPSAGLSRLIHDGCETALTRRHWRATIHELAGSNTELHDASLRLQALLDERTASLAHAQLLLRQQHEEMVRLETQAVVSQIARGLAHELNNPLAAILGYSQRLRRTYTKDPEAVRRLDVILGEVDRCRSLVEQLRNLAAPLEEEPAPCSPGPLLTQAAARLRESGVVVPEVVVASRVPTVLAAPQSLSRVFEQVLDNASLAGARTVWLEGAEANGHVRLQLANDGATPDEGTVRNATRPFFTTMADQGRRGLGLAIANALLRDQNGSLELMTRTDDAPGAMAVVQLPAGPAAAVPSGRSASATAGTVLVVDDEPLVAELLLDALNESGHPCRVVGSVAEALAAVQEGPLRALIADVRLPDGSGVDLASRALMLRPELVGHVALITGSGDARDKLGLPPGADWPVLSKPFRLEQIARLVRSIV